MESLKILDYSELTKLIHYERERTDRTNNPFSLIHVYIKINEQIDGQKIIKKIALSIRTIDRVSKINNNTLCVLLPETQIAGAKIVALKLKKELMESMGENLSLLDFVVSTYPEFTDDKVMKIPSNETTSWPSSQAATREMEYPSNFLMADVMTADSSSILDLEKIGLREDWQFVMKRLIDIVGSIFGLIFFSPPMLIIAAAIKLTSKGPVLFQQERLGYRGRTFLFLKFRSMYADNDESIHREYIEKLIQGNHDETNTGSEEQPYYKIKNDPRVTPLGNILRKSSMDELPQFLNVLMGQMSLVGPRPSVGYELNSYQNWHMKRVLNVKPGITGLWQVKARSQTTFGEMVRLDLQYIKTWSLWLDFKIMAKTFKVMLLGNGAD